MQSALAFFWRYLRAFIILYLCLYLGNALSQILPVSIPGSISGMLILFLLLATRLMPTDWVYPASNLLIRYMALLFVPISVGIMNDVDILRVQFAPIVIACGVSTLIVLITVAIVSQRLHGGMPSGEENE